MERDDHHIKFVTIVSANISDERCEAKSGLLYDEKCYFTPSFSFSSSLNYDDAVQKCNNEKASIAEIHTRNQQETIENFFRPKMPSSRTWIEFYTGTLYQSSVGNT